MRISDWSSDVCSSDLFYGSALQIEYLRALEIPEGANVVALHALNPWGFSYLSRTDDQNIDVNRNFTEYGVAYAQDKAYPILFRALCPADWTEETIKRMGTRLHHSHYCARRMPSH